MLTKRLLGSPASVRRTWSARALMLFSSSGITPVYCSLTSKAGANISTVTLSTFPAFKCRLRIFTPESVSNLIVVLSVIPFSYRYLAMHRLALPHIIASEPSALKIRIE